jgi:hypothetical protein
MHSMRPIIVLSLALALILVLGAPALARSPRGKHAAGPPPPAFPWPVVLETVGPLTLIWLGTILLRKSGSKENSDPLSPVGKLASLPVVWFTAMSDIFKKRAPDPNAKLPDSTSKTDLPVLTPPS